MRIFAFLVLIIAWPLKSLAETANNPLDTLSGTLAVYHQPYLVGGKLQGCQIMFEHLMRDWVTRRGQFIRVDGSISLMYPAPQKLGATLKIVVNEIDLKTMNFKASAPTRAFLIDDDYSTTIQSIVSSTASDTPGGLFSIYQVSPTFEIVLKAIQSNKLRVGFDRAGAETDIQALIELDVSATDPDGSRHRTGQAGRDFATCAQALIKR